MNADERHKSMVFVVDDDVRLAQTVCGVLDRAGHETKAFHDGASAVSAVSERPPDLALLDLMLPDMSGLDVLRRIREGHPGLAVVMMSGKGTIKSAVEAVKLGAYDFMEKPLDANRLRVTVRNALERSILQRQAKRFRAELEDRYQMVGGSPALRQVRELVGRVAPTNASVLVAGESGTGKELIAWAVHLISPRAAEPFVALNCAAIPKELVESELFGHKKGAFTGAASARKGRLEQADRGTLFLDEIGNMGLEAQAKLLRFLDTPEIQRLGDSETVALDVRVIAATNKNLPECVKEGSFREDLFHRLNVVAIEAPPLRKRIEDIEPLAEHFLARYCRQHNRSVMLAPGCMDVLRSHDWPGNVRDLRNLMERVVVLARTSPVEPEELRLLIGVEKRAAGDGSLRSVLEQAEKEAVESALAKAGGNITRAASMLGVERPSLHRIMKRHGFGTPSSSPGEKSK